ncbi:hypothetical protein PV325_000743 [Microctonus aethiopoides]|nr:hypothetical protein PV325_000743 [Microctonus aethiopoides]
MTANGDVTKIELELEEAPIDGSDGNDVDGLHAILVDSMSPESDSTAEINSTYPGGFPRPGSVVVRAEEALIVIFVLLLWVAAIALFFNRWGKIRMLEPYQPKFQQQHRASCAVVESTPLRSCSKLNLHCVDHSLCQFNAHPRQNSVFVDSSVSLLGNNENEPRRTKSAFDLKSLVVEEDLDQQYKQRRQQFQQLQLKSCRVDEDEIIENYPTTITTTSTIMPITTSTTTTVLKPFNEYPRLSRSFQRERGMSICQFDRTDVLARPLQRERGMSICHFDRMDVLARPMLRDRGMSICHFDRMDVLARPLIRGSRGNIFKNNTNTFDSTISNSTRWQQQYQHDNRLSVGNVEGSMKFLHQRSREFRSNIVSIERSESLGRNSTMMINDKTITNNISPLDRPSCSKTPDVVLGYKATCV